MGTEFLGEEISNSFLKILSVLRGARVASLNLLIVYGHVRFNLARCEIGWRLLTVGHQDRHFRGFGRSVLRVRPPSKMEGATTRIELAHFFVGHVDMTTMQEVLYMVQLRFGLVVFVLVQEGAKVT